MKGLIDECVDWRLCRFIPGHEVKTAKQMGWAAKQNGELLAVASGQFQVLITLDQNLSFQQNVRRFVIAVIVMRAKSDRLTDLKLLLPDLLTAISTAGQGKVTYVGP